MLKSQTKNKARQKKKEKKVDMGKRRSRKDYSQHCDVNSVPAKLNGVGKSLPEQNSVHNKGVMAALSGDCASSNVRDAGAASLCNQNSNQYLPGSKESNVLTRSIRRPSS
jgi:hypothetical protein